ncbi:hypothetical protein D5018_00850 [Parashewanella curva]|uniref:Uncharacterized protein n=1 Tax=Parashewanella curva TaxID=2338552 RepID=A0A3L8Q3D1_9GAMM|nr:hypothetical protein [Parashewanella curva]RLV61698.1 hypothetical protein D5018_00850 [Parashewanella curva]
MAQPITASNQAPSYYSTTLEKTEAIAGSMISGLMFGGLKGAAINGGLALGKVFFDETVYQSAPKLANSEVYRFVSGTTDILVTSVGPMKSKGIPQALGAAATEIAAKLTNLNASEKEPTESGKSQTGLWDVTLSLVTRVGAGLLWQQQTKVLASKEPLTPSQDGSKLTHTMATTFLVKIAGEAAQVGDPFRNSTNIIV